MNSGASVTSSSHLFKQLCACAWLKSHWQH
ncbi:TPA: hypothetical protein MYQ04_004225 [Citrobacter braakii]|nr:hypothetical protein [Citrobacter braakii]